MAARDRFGQWPTDPGESPLKRYIRNACDPVKFEPDLALNLEIADLINQKKGTAPREAAVAIVNYINHRNPNVSLLALALLDICVKNCGYPFHLQISTKDFLNQLVRRFPERPPMRPNRVQLKILEALEEWRQTICQTSRYKDDLGFIRDMHRLLSYKGYMFPEVRREDAAVLNPSDALKSAEEMEEEEREAQSAKLQELIRRGTPADLQEANHLMKIMAGYDQTSKTDYRAKAAEDIGKLGQKAQLLEEMLGRVKPGETIGQQDTFEDLASALKTAQPKIQRMVEEESEDTDAVVKLLGLNDIINTTLERYMLVKRGNLDAAKALPATAIPEAASTALSSAPAEDSLIDLDGDLNGQSSQSGPSGSTGSLQDDLLGLSIDDPDASIGAGGGIALGFGANTNIPGPPLLSSTLEANTANTAGQQQYSPFAKSPSPQPNPSTSAFSNLVSPKLPSLQTTNPFLAFSNPPAQPQAPKSDDDEWAFSSALPPSSEPERPSLGQNEVLISDSNLRVVLDATRPTTMPEGPIVLKAKFSNNTNEVLQDLTFQMAVAKTLALKMEFQTGRVLQPRQIDGITQIIRVAGVSQGGGRSLKMRWKVSYRIGNGSLVEEQGAVEGLPVS